MQEMLRALTLVFGLISPVFAAQAADVPRIAPRPLASALDAMEAGRWEVAARLAARDGKAAADLIEWHRLRAGLGEPDEILVFLERNAHWPGLDYLRRQSEEAMTHADFDDVLAFYDGDRPQTGTGALNLARALLARGRQGEAEAGVVLAWRTLDLSTAEHDDFLRDFGDLLRPHHAARLQMALWRGLRDVEDMLPLVSAETRALAETRGTVKRGETEGLTEAQARNPGIAFELFTRHLSNAPEEAIAVLLRQSRIEAGLGEPERWASWRRALARQKMREGEPRRAYDIASVHQLVEGANYADLEWLSGYLALTYFDAPELALDHSSGSARRLARRSRWGARGTGSDERRTRWAIPRPRSSPMPKARHTRPAFTGFWPLKRRGCRWMTRWPGPRRSHLGARQSLPKATCTRSGRWRSGWAIWGWRGGFSSIWRTVRTGPVWARWGRCWPNWSSRIFR